MISELELEGYVGVDMTGGKKMLYLCRDKGVGKSRCLPRSAGTSVWPVHCAVDEGSEWLRSIRAALP